jgi:hypothetical protein
MDGEQKQQNDVQFDSANIGKKEKPNYFSGRVRKNPVKDFFSNIFNGRNKYITIGVVAGIVVVIVVVVLWITVWGPALSQNGGNGDVSGDQWQTELQEINGEANTILRSDSDTAFFDAVSFLDEKISTTDNDNQRFDLTVTRANFIIFNGGSGGAQDAIVGLSEIDESGLTNEQKFSLFKAFRFAYQRLDDQGMVQYYEDRINNELPKDITTNGGPADE